MVGEELDVLVVGGANTDFVIRGAALPTPGATLEGEEWLQGPGGKGANQAAACARLGAKVAMVGRVGSDDRGTSLLASLERVGVDTRLVSRDLAAPTGAALVMVERGGEKQIMTVPGANRELSVREVADAVDLIAHARVVLVQLEIPLEAVATAVRLGRAAGSRVILDPAPPRALTEELLRDVHMIRLNAAEAEVLTGVPVIDEDSARQAGENLLRRGLGAAVVGAPRGNLLLTNGVRRWFPLLPVEVVDSTGAGDAFSGALAVTMAERDDIEYAVRFANATAALACRKLGAQASLPDRGEVEQLLRRM